MWVPYSLLVVPLVPTARRNLRNYFPTRAATQGRPYDKAGLSLLTLSMATVLRCL